jgi:hypothetical protein
MAFLVMGSSWTACSVLPTLLLFAATAGTTDANPTRAPSAQPATIHIDGAAAGWLHHGHGALSAGGSSRLLHDYAEPMRGDLLDYLFKPSWGAGLTVLKIEIGGDTQSTDGTEPSHMHYRSERSQCGRGYEAWLATEAKRRSSDLSLYALSWGVPGWVGNGSTSTGPIGESFCTDENIAYQTEWVSCMRSSYQLSIDYLGVWNEMSWCGEAYVLALRAALDAAGHTATSIVLPDSGPSNRDLAGNQFQTVARRSPQLRAAMGGARNRAVMGFHYPCNYPDLQIPGVSAWASEDFSSRNLGTADPAGGPGWTSGSYWGRLLNQNFVRMNMSTTIAWALVWSVLPGGGCDGDGLTLANTPWSGHYETDAAVWTSAHWGQFIRPGWKLLAVGQGSGLLPAGGSYVGAVSANGHQFAVVIETLQGKGVGPACKLAQNTTTVQTVTITLAAALAPAVPAGGLALWRSVAAAMFVEQPRVIPRHGVDGTLSVVLTVQVDAMYTLTTVTTGHHGRAATAVPAAAPFALPFSDSFDGYANDTLAKYFTDQGGSFGVATGVAGGGGGGGVLRQWTRERPGANRWGGPKPSNPPPVTLVGTPTWQPHQTCVDATADGCVGAGASECYVMVCTHVTSFSTWSGWLPSSLCLQLNFTAATATDSGGGGMWGLVAYTNQPAAVVQLANGSHHSSSTAWNRLCLTTSGCGNVSATVDGVQVLPHGFDLGTRRVAAAGQTAVGTGWHTANFDNFSVSPTPAQPGGPSGPLLQCVNQCNGTQSFVGFVGGLVTVPATRNLTAVAVYCGGAATPPVRVSMEVVIAIQQQQQQQPTKATASQPQQHQLLRPGGGFDTAGSGRGWASGSGRGSGMGGGGYRVLSAVNVTVDQRCSGVDHAGFVWSELPAVVTLQPATGYVIAFQNKPGGLFYGVSGANMPQVSGGGVAVTPIYTGGSAGAVHAGTASWTVAGTIGSMYGPVNGR